MLFCLRGPPKHNGKTGYPERDDWACLFLGDLPTERKEAKTNPPPPTQTKQRNTRIQGHPVGFVSLCLSAEKNKKGGPPLTHSGVVFVPNPRPLLKDASLRPSCDQVAASTAKFCELLAVRKSTALLGLTEAGRIERRKPDPEFLWWWYAPEKIKRHGVFTRMQNKCY